MLMDFSSFHVIRESRNAMPSDSVSSVNWLLGLREFSMRFVHMAQQVLSTYRFQK